MRYRLSIPIAALLLGALTAPALADGRWCVSIAAGKSISTGYGSALDAAFIAELDPIVGLGIETGLAYMNDEPRYPGAIHFGPAGQNGDQVIAGLTDGISRNRGYYMGPVLKLGRTLYAVASAGLYEFSDNAGNPQGTRWGASGGIGLSGPGRFEPRAELRYRVARDDNSQASALQFTFGFHIR